MNEKVQHLEKQLAQFRNSDRNSVRYVDVLNELAWEIGLTETARALELGKDALALATTLEHPRSTALARRNVGYCNLLFGNHEVALAELQPALEQLRELKDGDGESTVLITLATVFWRLGSFDKALEHAFECLGLCRRIDNKIGEAWALHNIGLIYFEVGDASKAVDYQNQALARFREIGYEVGESRILTSLGESFETQGNLNEALSLHKAALALSKKHKISIGITGALSDIGRIYRSLGDHERAEAYFRESLAHPDSKNNVEFVALTHIHLGELLIALDRFDEALASLTSSHKLLTTSKANLVRFRLHHALAKLHEKTGDHEKALAEYKLYHTLKEEVYNQQQQTSLKNLQIRLEVEKSEQQAEIHRLKFVELARMQAQLVQSEKMAVLGKLTAGIAHEVNTPVGTLKSNADTLSRCLEKLKVALFDNPDRASADAVVRRLVGILEQTSRTTASATERVGRIVASLKNFARLDEAAVDRVDVHSCIENALALMQNALHDRITVFRSFEKLGQLHCRPGELNHVFLTLLMNAVEAIDDRGEIAIRTSKVESGIRVEISDTGRGIPQEKIDGLFELKFSKKEGRMGFGMGLLQARTIVEDHGGSMSVSSEPGKGTTFVIRLPYKNETTGEYNEIANV